MHNTFGGLRRGLASFACLAALGFVACGDSDDTDPADGSTSAGGGGNAGGAGGAGNVGAGGEGASSAGGMGGMGASGDCGTPQACGELWEENASNAYDELVMGDPEALKAFLTDVPKGADLHNHLSGSVYAETMLAWAQEDGNCISTVDHKAVFPNQCGGSNQAPPLSGPFFDEIVAAWSMEGFVPSAAESGHDHFFSTFGKFGLIAGFNRWESLADIALRASSENQLHIETMFNLGKGVGDLSASLWSGTFDEEDIPTLYESLINHPSFAAEVADDVDTVTSSFSGYREKLGCNGSNPPEACSVVLRFIAQVSRTGPKDTVFGQLVSAFEMARYTPLIVGANLSSPEDDPTSINNYRLHMAMLGFLHEKYTMTGLSPLEITLHAGELTEEFIPPGSDANTFHIKEAVEVAKADRIGHGIDILSEIEPQGIMQTMRERGVLVEVCLSSNIQILEVSGREHPLAVYIENDVPVALATDDQGVSRSSLAGEYMRAALDQKLSYRQLKTMARDSLQYAFLPGTGLWTSVKDGVPVAECMPTDTMGIGDPVNAECFAFLDGNEKAALQWELERRFRLFESQQ